ncbi:MAG: peptide chain release factor N(5)-glutamine methyltransferase [Armatimonadota bacterium]|nr:peptide chain release factor N(5)-glutamine methyltransferase [Armatimonadota bacterium]MDR7451129.1 peptide chain release factor N(5)-glutamine methyltransferase [Armatimonadota bacterium]MDR7467266.1 peptide chain release factor N(5)-glutamine methyltransferase [Armatimonadota bacterium]MDR7494527.1 peptide chain release factor N(5)-glutamine methyltransferase [Armatimonadota bacterium]MDR7499896.1 peptide chain release factor N(5)-glutamine methyltransferase [Armatimonadota bacterium]
MTIREAFLYGRRHLEGLGAAEPALEAEVLLRFLLGWDRAGLYARWDEPVPEEVFARYGALLRERARHRPLHYIVGEREFMGLRFAVDERVLIPRPETEVLVEYVAQWVREQHAASVADIGTGSGAIAISLAHLVPEILVFATDISPEALAVARANAERHGVAPRVHFRAGDLFQALPALWRGRLDVVVSNPPYVPQDQAFLLAPEIREFEPRQAIFVPGDGSLLHRRLIADAATWLRPGGLLAMEVGAGQADAVAGAIEQDGRYGDVLRLPDGVGIERAVAARRRHRAAEGDLRSGRK